MRGRSEVFLGSSEINIMTVLTSFLNNRNLLIYCICFCFAFPSCKLAFLSPTVESHDPAVGRCRAEACSGIFLHLKKKRNASAHLAASCASHLSISAYLVSFYISGEWVNLFSMELRRCCHLPGDVLLGAWILPPCFPHPQTTPHYSNS